MSHGYNTRTDIVLPVQPQPGIWAAYAAATWAFVFAAMSFYWASGGTAGVATLSPEIVTMARNPWFTLIVWGTAVLKLIAGALALGLIQRCGRRLPQWFLLATIWSMGGFMVLYGGANLLVRGLMVLGILTTPASMLSTAAWWHVFWDSWWLAGGILFCAAAWAARRHRGSIRRQT